VTTVPESVPEKHDLGGDVAQVVPASSETSDDDEPTEEEKQTLRRGTDDTYLCAYIH
jgi:hypothetical protein